MTEMHTEKLEPGELYTLCLLGKEFQAVTIWEEEVHC